MPPHTPLLWEKVAMDRADPAILAQHGPGETPDPDHRNSPGPRGHDFHGCRVSVRPSVADLMALELEKELCFHVRTPSMA